MATVYIHSFSLSKLLFPCLPGSLIKRGFAKTWATSKMDLKFHSYVLLDASISVRCYIVNYLLHLDLLMSIAHGARPVQPPGV